MSYKSFHLGVLLVHGIGEQKRGETLTEFGTPLVEWLSSRAEAERTKARVMRANITEGDDDEPAHAEIAVGEGDHEQRWLMAEAWWAESFNKPKFSDLARWGFAVAPW